MVVWEEEEEEEEEEEAMVRQTSQSESCGDGSASPASPLEHRDLPRLRIHCGFKLEV